MKKKKKILCKPLLGMLCQEDIGIWVIQNSQMHRKPLYYEIPIPKQQRGQLFPG